MVGKQISHFEGQIDYPGSGGAVFLEEGSNGKKVIKVSRADDIIEDLVHGEKATLAGRISDAVHIENYYIQEIEAMKLADRLGLRKFYGEVEVKNLDRLLDSSVYAENRYLLSKRAYSMDYVDGGWPSEMRQYITQETLTDAMAKYRRLYDAGYVQGDFQFLVTREGKAEIIDFGSVRPITTGSSFDTWDSVLARIKQELGLSD